MSSGAVKAETRRAYQGARDLLGFHVLVVFVMRGEPGQRLGKPGRNVTPCPFPVELPYLHLKKSFIVFPVIAGTP
jgi:hypothetical protein